MNSYIGEVGKKSAVKRKKLLPMAIINYTVHLIVMKLVLERMKYIFRR